MVSIGTPIESPTSLGLRRSWRFSTTPVDGTSGTLVGVADPGDVLIDYTNKKLYVNTNTKASPTWSQILTAGVAFAGDLEIVGDVDITGDVDVGTEDVSVDQGRFVYLDGQDGAEYITSDAANELMINATTTLNLAIGGTDKVTLTATTLDISAASITLDDGYSVKWGADVDMDMFWYAGGPYFWFKLLADIDIQWGESGIGAQYTWHQKTAQQNMILGGGALTLNTTYIRMAGATGAGLIVAITGGGDGVRFESATLGNAIDFEATCTITTGINMAAAATTHISISGASNTALLIAASAGVIDVNDTTASVSTSTGSINTAGGLGVALDVFIGGDLYLASGKKIDFNAGNVTITHSAGILAIAGGGITMATIATAIALTDPTTAGLSITWTASATEGIAMTTPDATVVDVGMSMSGAGTYTDGILLDASNFVDGIHISGTCSSYAMNITGGGVIIGAAGAGRLTQLFDGVKSLHIYTTSASTDGGTSLEPQRFDNVVTGIGQVGGRFRVNLSTDVAMGSWGNAFKAQLECNDTGGSIGLLSAICAELVYPKNGIGNFAVLELEATTPADTFTGAQNFQSFILCNSTGSTTAAFQDYAAFIHFDAGMVAGTGNMIGAGYSTIRIAFGTNQSTDMYIPLSSAEGSFTSAYPVALTYGGEALDITCTTTTIGVQFTLTMAAPAMNDGIGLFEVNGNISTSPTGHFAAASTWINIAAAVTLPNALNIYAVNSDGIYQDGGGAISGGILIFGSRLQAQMGDTSGWNLLCPWSINTTIAITALIHAANPVVDLGMVTDAGSDDGTLVPFQVSNNGTIRYVKMYSLA